MKDRRKPELICLCYWSMKEIDGRLRNVRSENIYCPVHGGCFDRRVLQQRRDNPDRRKP